MTAERKLFWALVVLGLWAVLELLVALLPFDDLGTIILSPDTAPAVAVP